MIDQLGMDLTAAARRTSSTRSSGELEEIERVIQILSRRTKNNPALIGEPASARRRSSRAWPSGSRLTTFPRR